MVSITGIVINSTFCQVDEFSLESASLQALTPAGACELPFGQGLLVSGNFKHRAAAAIPQQGLIIRIDINCEVPATVSLPTSAVQQSELNVDSAASAAVFLNAKLGLTASSSS